LRRLYLDTSLLVGALVHEAGTATAVSFLQAHAKQPLLISPWVTTELASALALQVRRGAITAQECQEAWQRFGVFRTHRLHTLPLAAEAFETAARLCLAQVPPLRGADALHLALCQRLKLQLASFDRGLCKAAAHHQVAHQQLVIGASLKKPRSLLSGSHLRPQRQVLAKLARLIKCGVESCAGQHAGCQKPALATGEGSPGR
jgi:predicted nucleic acid-binding protein